jgi:hypothetical protein
MNTGSELTERRRKEPDNRVAAGSADQGHPLKENIWRLT